MSKINFKILYVRYSGDYQQSKEEEIAKTSLRPLTSFDRSDMDYLEKTLSPLCRTIFEKDIKITDEWSNVGLKVMIDDFKKDVAVEYKSNLDTIRKTKHTTIGHIAFSTMEFMAYASINNLYGAEYVLFNKKVKNTNITTLQLSMRIYTQSNNIENALMLFPPSCVSYKKITFTKNGEKSEIIKRVRFYHT